MRTRENGIRWGRVVEERLTRLSKQRALTDRESMLLEYAIKEQSRGRPGYFGSRHSRCQDGVRAI